MFSRYISGRQVTDKAAHLFDSTADRVKILLTAKPDVAKDKNAIFRRWNAIAMQPSGINCMESTHKMQLNSRN